MTFALVIAAWALIATLCAWLVVQVVVGVRERRRPAWRKLPSLTGLPPNLEWQTWTVMDFDPAELSYALVLALDYLTPIYGLRGVYGALSGTGFLIYAKSTYPADECVEALVPGGASGPYRRIAVEKDLSGLAHAVAHALDRHAHIDTPHHDWDRRGVYAACDAYQARRGRVFVHRP